MCGRGVCFQQVVQESVNILTVFCHSFFQYIVCICLESQQLSNFHTLVYQLFHNFDIVPFVIVCTLCIVCHIHLLSQFTAVAVFHERHIARSLQSEYPSFLVFTFCCMFGSFHSAFRQSFQIVLVCDVQFEFVGFLQVVLREFQCKRTQFGRQLSESLLVIIVQVGAVSDKSVVCLFKQSVLFCGQLQTVFLFIHFFHLFEQNRIQTDVITVFGQFRHQFFRYGIELVVGFGTHQIEEHCSYLVQKFSRMFQCQYCVSEVRLFRIFGNCLYLFVFHSHAFPYGRFVVRNFNSVERSGIVRCVIWL